MTEISIHALLAESDGKAQTFEIAPLSISIHALLAESDAYILTIIICIALFLSTLSLRRATKLILIISQHSEPFLSTLSLRRATKPHKLAGLKLVFLSTLSLRRATQSSAKSTPEVANFYPRSPCGERQYVCMLAMAGVPISIHALLAESDQTHSALPLPA